MKKPLENNGEALMLAVKLKLGLEVYNCFCEVEWVNTELSETFTIEERWGAGQVPLRKKMELVRRAIVRMAAKVAEIKQQQEESK
jgi:hypothetical protein